MYLGVLVEYGKILLAFSPFALKYFLRILGINTHVAENSTVYYMKLLMQSEAQVQTPAVANFDDFLCAKFN
jgi:hypothetical protein